MADSGALDRQDAPLLTVVSGAVRLDGKQVAYIATAPFRSDGRRQRIRAWIVPITAVDRALARLLTAYALWKAVTR